jgi:hypothetical protein
MLNLIELPVLAFLFVLLTSASGSLIWLVRLEGRIKVVEQRQDDFCKWLERIEEKLDRALMA